MTLCWERLYEKVCKKAGRRFPAIREKPGGGGLDAPHGPARVDKFMNATKTSFGLSPILTTLTCFVVDKVGIFCQYLEKR